MKGSLIPFAPPMHGYKVTLDATVTVDVRAISEEQAVQTAKLIAESLGSTGCNVNHEPRVVDVQRT